MATETQRHRVLKTLGVSSGRNKMFQGDVIVCEMTLLAASDRSVNNRARQVLFAHSHSRFLCASVPLWPSFWLIRA